jgi:hypothetical protein
MPNGWDRNWVRFVSTVASFKAEFGHWPERVSADPQLLFYFRELFSPDLFAVLEKRLQIAGDDGVDSTEFFRAEDNSGHSLRYQGPGKGNADEARRWLGVAPDNPHGLED